jgi:hypothetical protein
MTMNHIPSPHASPWRLLLLGFLLVAGTLSAQEKADTTAQKADSTEQKNIDWFAYPYVFYSPETDFAVGGGGIVYFYLSRDSLTKPSSITPSFYYSINKQFDFTIFPEVYFAQGKYYLYAYLSVGEYIDKFYGVGPTTVDIPEPGYLYRNAIIRGNFQWSFASDMKLGAVVDFQDRQILDKKANPYLLSDTVRGSEGGRTVGIGPIASWDTRNHRFYPSDGHLFEISALFVSRAFGGDYDFNRFKVDLRWYHRLAKTEDHIIGIQGYGCFVRGFPGFYDLSAMGGKMLMRGYYTGRYRDYDYAAGQAEYRTRVLRRLGLVVFAGAGMVNSPSNPLRLKDLKPCYGFGIRYVFDVLEKIDIRADFGYGPGTTGAYVDIQQAF